ncbi:MAG TPA: hypothetical protein VHJ69_09470 [Gemmatimonadales bacterium]|nr:hypothetical protein [Gemmatimonadales bacterium]
MYRIELGPEDIGVFRSIEEMARAIKTGVITSKARIYHSASDKWLPIEFHPHFKKAREMAAGPVAPAPIQPVPVRAESEAPVRRTPTPPRSPVAGLPLIDVSPAVEPAAPAPVPAQGSAPAPTPAPAPALWMAPTLPEPKSMMAAPPHPVAEPEREAEPEPEPATPEPPAMKPPVSEVVFPDEPEPAPTPEPFAAYLAPEPMSIPVFEHVPPLDPIPLPEPERDAIFLAAQSEPPAEASGEPVASVAEPSPPFQLPRVDLRLGRRRRPILIAAAAVTLAGSTHLALSANRPQVELGVGVPLPVPELGPRTLSAERPAQPATNNATVLPASVPASKGSPSFGGASAFVTPEETTKLTSPQPAEVAPVPAPVPKIAPPPKIAIAAPKAVAAPSLEGDLKSGAGLVARYESAHTAARAELDNGLRTAGFANLFATSRLQPSGLRAARAAVGTASAYVQRYRRREAEIEQAYRDSFDLLSNRNKWSDGQWRTWEGRKIRQEHPEIAKLSSFLLQSLDSLYGLLAAHEAEYRIADGTITFDNAAASRAYGELKPWLDRRAHAWADIDSNEPTTAARILRAMGTAKLPEGGSL